MIVGGGSPLNRVHEVLQRMQENIDHIESLKTCCGILAVLSRDEANKLLIARDGMRLIITVMQSHLGKVDLQEAACDLLWSLAFNNSLVKELVGRHGGIAVIIKGMQKHSASPDFLKSACGALSNMCQNAHNQNLIVTHGGITCLMKALGKHRTNPPLLPFLFDAMASLIVGNERNGLQMSEAGAIYEILAILSAHIHRGDMVKSGCHALAILSDIQGQGAKIARANGVKVVLAALRHHPGHSELHRVAAVVALRMLQEASVAGEIARGGGVPIMLAILKAHVEELETVAATIHILYLITHPEVLKGPPLIDVDQQIHSNGPASVPAVDSLVLVLLRYGSRKDLARAAVRSMVNLMRYPIVTSYLLQADALEVLLRCPCLVQGWSRDVTDGSITLLKAWGRSSGSPSLTGTVQSLGDGHWGQGGGSSRCSARCTGGLLACLAARPSDFDLGALVFGMLAEMYIASPRSQQNPPVSTLVSSQLSGGLQSKDQIDNGTPLLQEVDVEWEVFVVKATAIWLRQQSSSSQPGKTEASKDSLVQERTRTRSGLGLSGNKVYDICSKLCLLLSTLIKSKQSKEMMEEHCVADALESFLAMLPPDEDTSISLTRQTIQLLKGHITAITYTAFLSGGSNNSHTPLNSPTRKLSQAGIRLDFQVSDLSLTGDHEARSQEMLKTSGHDGSRGNNKSPMRRGEELMMSSDDRISRKNEEDGEKDGRPKEDGRGGAGAGRRRRKSFKSSGPPNILMIPVSDAREPIVKPSIAEFMNELRGEALYGAREELQPMMLVYEGRSAAGLDVISRVETPVPYEVVTPARGPDGNVVNPFTHQLTFDSCFESGNLLRAVQRGVAEYDLFLRGDLHTPGQTQWFYFSVSNTHSPCTLERGITKSSVTFNIVNLTKPDSLFNKGMRPVMLSYQNLQTKTIGWQRTGYNITYRANNYKRGFQAVDASNTYFTLSFTVDFLNPNDTYLLAHSYPYTLADNKLHLKSLMDDPRRRPYIHQGVLCQTLAGNECDLITVAQFDSASDERANSNPRERARGTPTTPFANPNTGEVRGKRCIVISARVHPGETPASWMMRGFLDFITGNSDEARTLRSQFVFKIVPMLNPDGVQFGNNRCSLAGVDLNRQWKRPSRTLHPTVYYLKSLIRAEKQFNDVVMYIDLHGHSRKMNIFLYGLEEKRQKGKNLQVRMFPRLVSCNRFGKNYVSFADCSFNAKKGRETTARVVVSRELGIKCSYTLEATFCGADFGPLKNCHFNLFHLQEVGRSLADSFLDFYCNGEVNIPDSLDLVAEAKQKKGANSEDIESESDTDDGEQSTGEFTTSEEIKPSRRRHSTRSKGIAAKRWRQKPFVSSSLGPSNEGRPATRHLGSAVSSPAVPGLQADQTISTVSSSRQSSESREETRRPATASTSVCKLSPLLTSKDISSSQGSLKNDYWEENDPANIRRMQIRPSSKVRMKPSVLADHQALELPSVTGTQYVDKLNEDRENTLPTDPQKGILLGFRSSSAPVKGKPPQRRDSRLVRLKHPEWLESAIRSQLQQK